MKPTYLEGVKECESLYQSGLTFIELRSFIEKESSILDYRWSEWVLGFLDGIMHFEMLEGLYEI